MYAQSKEDISSLAQSCRFGVLWHIVNTCSNLVLIKRFKLSSYKTIYNFSIFIIYINIFTLNVYIYVFYIKDRWRELCSEFHKTREIRDYCVWYAFPCFATRTVHLVHCTATLHIISRHNYTSSILHITHCIKPYRDPMYF